VALARIKAQAGDAAAAEGILAALLKRYPKNPEVLGLQGWLAMRQGRPKDAVAAFKKASAKASTGQMVIDLARVQWEAKEWDDSIETLENWLERHPEDVRVRFELGMLHMIHNRPAEARHAFEQVVRVAPDHAPALNNLAWLLRSEDPAAALAYAERANDIVPGNPAFMDTLGVILLEQGETERALRALRSVAEKTPDDPSVRYHLAKALVKNGDKAQAREMLEALLGEGKRFMEEWEARALLKALEG